MSNSTKVTYVSLAAGDPKLADDLDAAFAQVKTRLGQTQAIFVDGQPRTSAASFDSHNPADTGIVIARASIASPNDIDDAVAAARRSYPAWRQRAWSERADIIARAATLIRQRRLELSAWCVLEMGKSRIEALGEIEETADLYDYYVEQMRLHDGYRVPMARLAPQDDNTSVLRPYGVWAVIAPWNFPYALFGAPIAAALLTGNTVVAKPASDTPMAGVLLTQIFHEAGVPSGAINLVMGSAKAVGAPLVHHPDIAGLTFTGSYGAGFSDIYRTFATRYPKPCIVEMGGKNPAIIMPSADLDQAAQGVFRSAFGMNGHKCSACSRVYVHRDVAPGFLERLKALSEAARIGDPSERDVFLGPLATARSLADYEKFVAVAKADARIVTGAERPTTAALARGWFAKPTILTGVPRSHALMRDELFVPIVAVEPIASLDEALTLANATDFGLTAGVFSREQHEIDTFLDGIEAGVVYVNRAAGATTGAWPGVQPFGGWKGSGSTGKNIGGVYTLPTYMREQSRTVCRIS